MTGTTKRVLSVDTNDVFVRLHFSKVEGTMTSSVRCKARLQRHKWFVSCTFGISITPILHTMYNGRSQNTVNMAAMENTATDAIST